MYLSSFPALFIGGEIVDLVGETGPVAKVVLLVLLAFSLISWAIILSKWSLLRRARVQSGTVSCGPFARRSASGCGRRRRTVPSQPAGGSF